MVGKYKVLENALDNLSIRVVYNCYISKVEELNNLGELEYFIKKYFEKISDVIDSDSSITKQELNIFWKVSEKVYERIGASKRSYNQAYFKYLQRTGHWEKALEMSSKWMVLQRDETSTSVVTEEIDRFIHYCMINDYSNAFFILEKAFEKSHYLQGDKEKFYIMPLRYKLNKNNIDSLKRDIRIIEGQIQINKHSKNYITEYLKVMSVIKPKKALVGLKYVRSLKLSDNERVKFDLAIIAENIINSIEKALNPRTKEYLEECIKVGFNIQRKMNARNKSVMYTEEIIFWRKTRELVGEL